MHKPAKCRQHLDEYELRGANPETHRTICSANSGDILDTDAIDRMEKLEIDELANAAYWHAVETLIDWEPGVLAWGFYDLMPRVGGPRIGKLNGSIYFPEDLVGQMAAQVIEENTSACVQNQRRSLGNGWHDDHKARRQHL